MLKPTHNLSWHAEPIQLSEFCHVLHKQFELSLLQKFSQAFCAREERTIILILCSRSTKPVDLSTDRIAVFRKIFV